MAVPIWLSGTFSHSPARRAQRRNPAATSLHRRHSFRPGLEALEIRLTLSLTTLASFGPTVYGSDPAAALIMDSSGNLYGTACTGGAYGDYGAVFELADGSGTITPLASFNGTDGARPDGALITDSSGNLYGTTTYGGASSDGTVFEVAKGSGTITTLASFNGTDGANPYATLVMDSSGNLYGTTAGGGASNDGTVFELAKATGTITTLASFNGTNGANPLAGLIMDSSGNLYGTTESGGASSAGTVFELAKGSGTITTLASFNNDGVNPEAALVMDSSGNLYGTTSSGGAEDYGTVFELAQGSGTITTLASFNGATDGAGPLGGLVMDSSGNLYGTASQLGASNDGTVFELAQGSAKITRLASFSGADGWYPVAGLIMDSSGNLYSTTYYGGASGEGTVFKMAKGSRTITTLASFNGTLSRQPSGGLIMDSSGNLYGTTESGGASKDGTVFELAQGSGSATTLASFNGTDGKTPLAGLIMDSSGNLYGTAEVGGKSDDGTVFELAKGSGTITTLASFNGTDGANPYAALVMDSSGNLYGTASGGGASADGTVFELAKGSGTITTLASFNATDGTDPLGGVIMDESGNLYGTAETGGASGDGTVFELAKGSGTITTLASFNATVGEWPRAGLTMDTSGNLYGTTGWGGASGDGTVFEVAKATGTITTLASFNGANGDEPSYSLIMDGSGNLYGTSWAGGAGDGTIYELAKGSGAITALVTFDDADGAFPDGPLIMDSSGNLYGTTYWCEGVGAVSGDGTVFELSGAASTPALQISGLPSSTSAGGPQAFTVTIQNPDGSTDTGYTGTVHFTSSDPQAVLPADYTFTAANAGAYTFTATLKTAGTQSITATDTANILVTGSATTTVTAAAASSLIVDGFPSPTTAGSAGNVTITALDAYGNIATGYTGTVQFTSSDPKAVLPVDYTFTSADAGNHVFSASLETAGTRSITAADTVTSGLSSTQTGIIVNPAAASVLVITGPSSVTADVAFSITVTAYDAYGNVATGYMGTIHFKSSDSTAKLPKNYTFTALDKGTHIFSGLVLKKRGQQSITATDTLFSSITGSLSVDVS